MIIYELGEFYSTDGQKIGYFEHFLQNALVSVCVSGGDC
jgi:hypothetical protein